MKRNNLVLYIGILILIISVLSAIFSVSQRMSVIAGFMIPIGLALTIVGFVNYKKKVA